MSETETIDVVETLEPSSPNYEIVIGDRTFTQKSLSFFGKIELFSVLADTIEKALSEGATLGELLEELPTDTQNVKASDLAETDVLVRVIAKLVKFAPEILEDVFCISLNVKRGEREEVKELLREELSDDEAMTILNQFINQNWDAIMDFFSKQVSPLIQNVSEKMQSRSTSSKPSKASPRSTAKK